MKCRGIQYTIFSLIHLWKNPLECNEWRPKCAIEILSNMPPIQLYKLTFEFCRKTITLLKSIIFFSIRTMCQSPYSYSCLLLQKKKPLQQNLWPPIYPLSNNWLILEKRELSFSLDLGTFGKRPPAIHPTGLSDVRKETTNTWVLCNIGRETPFCTELMPGKSAPLMLFPCDLLELILAPLLWRPGHIPWQFLKLL